MIAASEALERLRSGNLRFASGASRPNANSDSISRGELVDGQNPFAIILGCSDSRVPVEIVFDQNLGDLFVIRVAGNVVAPSQIGSIEFAAERFGTRLVVVLGHSRCGAVSATLEELERPTENRSPNLRSIVDRIRPSVESLLETPHDPNSNAFLERAIRANIKSSVEKLRHGSAILEELLRRNELHILGAEYSLETGAVDFFDEIPNTD